jgi:hypothetical protein
VVHQTDQKRPNGAWHGAKLAELNVNNHAAAKMQRHYLGTHRSHEE